jgi:hypothetical protein
VLSDLSADEVPRIVPTSADNITTPSFLVSSVDQLVGILLLSGHNVEFLARGMKPSFQSLRQTQGSSPDPGRGPRPGMREHRPAAFPRHRAPSNRSQLEHRATNTDQDHRASLGGAGTEC